MNRALVVLSLIGLLASGCARPEPAGLVASARFGVFFGGQIQQRKEIPLILDRAKQTQGFRIEFSQPLSTPVEVHWEIDMPGAGRRVRDIHGRIGKGRVTKLGQDTARAGLSRFDEELPFAPGASIGTWNIRVTVEDAVVIDRPFLVYDAAARRRAEREQASADDND